MVKRGGSSGLVALNSVPLPKTILLAVLPTNEPATSNWELAPKTMPLGLSKNKFAAPSTPRVPKILEMLLPVTRLRILLMPAGLAK